MKDHYYNSIGRVRQLLSPSLGLRDDYKHALSYNFAFFLASYIPCRFRLFLLVNFQLVGDSCSFPLPFPYTVQIPYYRYNLAMQHPSYIPNSLFLIVDFA